jgi:hypothetical protein
MLYYKDVILPTKPRSGRLLDDHGNLAESAGAASAGEIGFALIAKAIVEEAWRLDEGLRFHLKAMLDAA